jgi:hypothetical protein
MLKEQNLEGVIKQLMDYEYIQRKRNKSKGLNLDDDDDGGVI